MFRRSSLGRFRPSDDAHLREDARELARLRVAAFVGALEEIDLLFRLARVDRESVRRLIGDERAPRFPRPCFVNPRRVRRGRAARRGGERLIAVFVLLAIAHRVRFLRAEQLGGGAGDEVPDHGWIVDEGKSRAVAAAAGELGEQLDLALAPEEAEQRPRAGGDVFVAFDENAAAADIEEAHREVAEPAVERRLEGEALELAALVAHGMRLTSVIQ